MPDNDSEEKTRLPTVWDEYLRSQPETGMGYWVTRIKLRDGREFPRVAIVDGHVAEVFGYAQIPFDAGDIVELTVTHDRWRFRGT